MNEMIGATFELWTLDFDSFLQSKVTKPKSTMAARGHSDEMKGSRGKVRD